MATSGTVGLTTVKTSVLLEHAFRRCRVHPSKQTPEIVNAATQSLYIMLLGLANRGLNLWCVETQYVGCATGQATYVADTGVIDILNLVYSQPTRTTGTDTTAAKSVTTALTTATRIYRIGVKLSSVSASDTMTLASSSDGVTWTTFKMETKTDWATGTWYWIPLVTSVEAAYFRVSFGANISVTEFYLASQIYDLPVSQLNRDTWSVMTQKGQLGKPATSYYYEKLLTPQVTLWPVPNNDYDHLTMFVHRQVEDVGTLTEEIEIPQRWFEGIIWQLALRIAFECELVDPAMIPTIKTMADENLLTVEEGESDGAPIFLQPGIRVYTRS